MKKYIKKLRDKIFSNDKINLREALKLYSAGNKNFLTLYDAANEIKTKYFKNKVEICSLINVQSGNCSEDCAFCSQSSKYQTPIKKYTFLSNEEILKQAEQIKKTGVKRLCLVSSGRTISKNNFNEVLDVIYQINKSLKLECNSSFGFLNDEKIKKLKSAGIKEYNHNLETHPQIFNKIVTTHKFKDRVDTVKLVKQNNIKACCGGIIGMGESLKQRIELGFYWRRVQSDCVTVNILNAREGTPLQNVKILSPKEIIKTIAVYRFILPKAVIKVAGGREKNLRDLQPLSFLAGANGLITGGYLTTTGRSAKEDLQMIEDLGLEIA